MLNWGGALCASETGERDTKLAWDRSWENTTTGVAHHGTEALPGQVPRNTGTRKQKPEQRAISKTSHACRNTSLTARTYAMKWKNTKAASQLGAINKWWVKHNYHSLKKRSSTIPVMCHRMDSAWDLGYLGSTFFLVRMPFGPCDLVIWVHHCRCWQNAKKLS